MMFREVFCIFKIIMNNLFFFKHPFLLSNVHHSFSKLKRILLILILEKKKTLKIGEICFKTHLSTFSSNVFLTLKIIKFENVSLTQVIHFYVFKALMHNINDIDKDVLIFKKI